MALTDRDRERIEAMGYDELLAGWRNAPAGDPRFQGESGELWARRMRELRAAGADTVAASKRVGWEG